ncbi:LacI family DNA-binding transcriptional regulator [Yeosuana sp. MJ-SS3]|uniref:LacI family DNA-binding transcriptional regulator n=1 Tax=Gilvirhabdus luticola TaxID=3079858 RepID=A0ABU3U342_9FLAO|nr:LacI family DNA-binding transcriptional regulator [Yeosuana sp. MJ-SS3]MDU8884757.1 LacI family DNA-binding transcriptional regulator [Yeosuana sp. MJ-SS3]
MGSKTTLKDLARILEVSISTVSKALNDNPEISIETRNRIKQIAKSYKYVPNNIAQSLKSKSTKTIGVIIPAILLEFFSKVLYGIEVESTKRGYKIIICLSNELYKKESESIDTFINGSVDGIILSVAEETQKKKKHSHFQKIINYDVPMVMFDRVAKEIECDKVTVDDFEGAQKATKYLFKTGCENIVFINPISNISVGQLREDGYINAMQDLQLSPCVVNVDNYNLIEKELTELLQNKKIDGIVTADEYSAVLAINVARLNGYKIPDDISVIGFTNGLMAEYSIPSLTVVSQHAENIGKLAVKTLLDRIEGKSRKEPVHQIVRTKIIERNSTKKLN